MFFQFCLTILNLIISKEEQCADELEGEAMIPLYGPWFSPGLLTKLSLNQALLIGAQKAKQVS